MTTESYGSWPSPLIEGTNVQFAWDSTSLGLLKECPRKYQYTIIEGWRSKGESVHLKFGILFHSSLERYDIARANGDDHDEACDEVCEWLLQETGTYESPAEYSTVALWVPWTSDHPKKNRETLFRTVFWYLEEYKDDPAKTVILANGKPAVELSFKFDLPFLSPSGDPYIYCGHMDRLVTYADDVYVMDRKTSGSTIGAYYFAQYSPDNQMSGYTLAGKVVYDMPVSGVIIDAAQVAVGFSSYARGFTMRSDAQLAEWLDNTGIWLETAKRYAEVGVWPMNEKSCSNYGGCPFRGVCQKDPSVRELFLKSDFEKRFWNPLEER